MDAVNIVNARERCINIIKLFPAEHLAHLAISLEAMHKMIDTAADDAYCLELYQNSFGEDNDEPEDFHEFARRLGLDEK